MNEIKKIIYLIATPFNQRDYYRFGLDVFINDGFEAHVWDLSHFIHVNFEAPPDPIEFNNLRRFKSSAEVAAALQKVGADTFCISLLPHDRTTYKIFRLMSKKNIRYSIHHNAYAATGISLKNRVTHITIEKIVTRIKNLPMKIFGRIFPCESPTAIFWGGTQCSIDKTRYNQKTRQIWVHNWDYDVYLKDREIEEDKTNTAVFMDGYLPFHPHLISMKVVWAKADEYYPFLCRLFELVENNLGLRVVVAAHPRSQYEKHPDYYQGRDVIRGQSSRLVKNASLVILHGSASAYYPVLYKKPMMFVTTDGIQKTTFAREIQHFAGCFGKQPVNISGTLNIDLEEQMRINEEKYARFKNDYIKKEGAEDLPYWEIIKKTIRSL